MLLHGCSSIIHLLWLGTRTWNASEVYLGGLHRNYKKREVDRKNVTRWRDRETADGKTKRGGTNTAARRFGRGRWGSDESFFQVVCSPEATVDPDGLRLRGNRMCINIYSRLPSLFPPRLGKKSRTLGTQEASSHVALLTRDDAWRCVEFMFEDCFDHICFNELFICKWAPSHVYICMICEEEQVCLQMQEIICKCILVISVSKNWGCALRFRGQKRVIHPLREWRKMRDTAGGKMRQRNPLALLILNGPLCRVTKNNITCSIPPACLSINTNTCPIQHPPEASFIWAELIHGEGVHLIKHNILIIYNIKAQTF